MNRFSFLSNVVAALVLATVGAALHASLQPFAGSGLALRVMLIACASGYLAFLLHQLRPRFSVALMITGWLVLMLLLLLINPPLLLWLPALAGALWVMRCVLRYQTVLHAALDGLLNGVAGCVGFSVVMYTHSLWLGIWSYLLTLAFCVAIPARQPTRADTAPAHSEFNQAHASAERALKRLQQQSFHTV